jgi:hypothetical protein
LAIVFLLIFFVCPVLLLFGSELRERKRRLTLGEAMAWVALFALSFAVIGQGRGLPAILAVWVLWMSPLAFVALYVPKGWDLMLASPWVIATIALLVVGVAGW